MRRDTLAPWRRKVLQAGPHGSARTGYSACACGSCRRLRPQAINGYARRYSLGKHSRVQESRRRQLSRTQSISASAKPKSVPNMANRATSNTANPIDARLERHNLQREPTPGDGNCFFHAVHSLLARNKIQSYEPTQSDAHVLRQSVCDFVVRNYPLFQQAIDCEYGTVQHFLNVMRRSGTHADGNMANIICLMFDVNLHIHTEQ